MYIVTGAAGFIGSNVVKGLNDLGIEDILIVDDLSRSEKIRNLRDLQFVDFMDLTEFRLAVQQEALGMVPEAILHQGACADTMETDGRYMMDINYAYSKDLLEYAMQRSVPFIYASSASVYGDNSVFVESPENEKPLNVYAFSKWQFDRYAMHRVRQVEPSSTVVGLRYFNVYGPREAHKGRMQSMINQIYAQVRDTGTARLFEGSGGYDAGEQRRDFIYVGDVVAVNLHFMQAKTVQGVFNCGTGKSRSFNDIARTAIHLLGDGAITYIPFPEGLAEKYQSFTEADLTRLRDAGYDQPMTELEAGMAKTIAQCLALEG